MPHEVLLGNGPAGTWVAGQGATVPAGAYVAEQITAPVHVCRAHVAPDVRVGLIVAGGCMVVFNGTVHTVPAHEVLIGQ